MNFGRRQRSPSDGSASANRFDLRFDQPYLIWKSEGAEEDRERCRQTGGPGRLVVLSSREAIDATTRTDRVRFWTGQMVAEES